VLCLFFAVIHSQIRTKQLRREVLQSINPVKTPIKNLKQKSTKIAPPKPAVSIQQTPVVNPPQNNGVSMIHLDNAALTLYDKQRDPDMLVYKGNVMFRHDDARLYCDSAYYYEKANSFKAFGHVKMVQGDTVFVYGDLLYYDGNTKLARLRHRVRMENRKTTLTTDSLNYDRISNLAYYYTGGKITDQENVLTSLWGQYSTVSNEAVFKTNVHLINKNFTLDSDSLKYNTKSHIANLVSQTHILYNNETDIYSNKGWYNTTTEQSMLLNRSRVKHKDGKTLIGDTIFYDKAKKYGEGFTCVVMTDSVQKSTLIGNYVYYNENTKNGLATDSALLVDWSDKDVLSVHADTLFTYKDSIYNVAKGYYNVRFYRNDVQGVCDSLSFSARDSVMNLHGTPVLWSDKNQLAGDFIQVYTKNKKVNKIHIQRLAVAIQQEDSLFFNQLSGKEIIAYVDSGQLKRVNVNGNAETIYYPRDDKDSTLIGQNRTQSSYVVMYLKNKKVSRVVFTSSTNGIFSPLLGLKENKLHLNSFFWVENVRPKNQNDLFTTYPKIIRPKVSGIDALNPNTNSSPPTNSPASNLDFQPINNSRTNSLPNQNNQQMRKSIPTR
jgi:lipopolysaccharide export system protein LptA